MRTPGLLLVVVTVIAACDGDRSPATPPSSAAPPVPSTEPKPAAIEPEPAPTEPKPASSEWESRVAKMTEFADAACACGAGDKPCADRVVARLNVWLNESAASTHPDQPTLDRMAALDKRLMGCLEAANKSR